VRGTLPEPGIATGLFLSETTEPANHYRLSLLDLAGLGVHLVEDIESLKGRADRIGNQAARVAPEATEAAIAFRDGFLGFLVQVLTEVASGIHGPVNPVAGILVEAQGFGIVGRGQAAPGSSQLQAGFFIGRHRQEDVEVGSIALLELKQPEVADTRNQAAKGGQPGVEMALGFPAIGGPLVMIGQAELRDERRERIDGSKAKVAA